MSKVNEQTVSGIGRNSAQESSTPIIDRKSVEAQPGDSLTSLLFRHLGDGKGLINKEKLLSQSPGNYWTLRCLIGMTLGVNKNITNPNLIQPGQRIKFPTAAELEQLEAVAYSTGTSYNLGTVEFEPYRGPLMLDASQPLADGLGALLPKKYTYVGAANVTTEDALKRD